MEKQRTVKQEILLKGRGLHTGAQVEIKILPAPVNFGYQFKRLDLPEEPIIKAMAENVSQTDRGTTLKQGEAMVYTIEHLLAALYGLQIDNALIELNGPEIPIFNGSSKPIVDALNKIGFTEQEEDREYFEISEKIVYKDEKSGSEIIAYPDSESLSIDVLIDYNSKILGNQYASIYDISEFEKEISPCRTFVFLHELEQLVKADLIKGGDVDNAIVIVDKQLSQEELDRLAELFNKPKVKVLPEGILNNIELNFPNEPARHKLLDVIGDLSLSGVPLKAKIVAKKPGHHANTEFAKIIQKIIKSEQKKAKPPKYDPNKPPLFDVLEIQNRIPHRPPFLLVDKILEMDEWNVTGVKNVTMNEAHFVGHFPKEPVMPGVLQIEAMAQVGAILLTSFVENRDNYLTLFLKIDSIKFKNKVVPGDTLVIKMTLTEPIKRGLAITRGQGFVGDKLVIEGEFMAQLVKIK